MPEDAWSVAESTVLRRARQFLDSDQRGVLATIADVEGSAYRRPGAKMLVSPDGDGFGSITAGCIEDEVRSLAAAVLDADRPRVETFDLMGDDDIWGLGVGCNGVIDILLEPLDEGHRAMFNAYEDDIPVASATVVDSSVEGVEQWEHLYYRPDTGVTTADGAAPGWFEDDLARKASHVLEEDASDTITVEEPHGRGTVEVFVDGITPPPELLVAGTGPDVRPLVEVAGKNDFRTTVVGFRGATATEEQFPSADQVIATSPATIRDDVALGENTYAVVMTHNFIDDRLALDELVKSPVPYVGLMGPRKRFEEMREEFEAEDRSFSSDELDVIYTPVGLDLGGGTPYQIASSIVAEVLAVSNERTPTHLKDREGSIHGRVDTEPPS